MAPAAPRIAVFDLDGTLVETAPDLHAVLAEVMAEQGRPVPDLAAVRAMIGDGARALLVKAFAAHGEALTGPELDRLYARFVEIYTEAPCRHSTLFPGVEPCLASLRARGWRLAVCTNKPQAPSLGVLEALGLLRHLEVVVGGDVLAVRKPDPAHLAAALAPFGAAAADAVMVGDSRNDLLTARGLGVPCVLVSFGYTAVPARELGADRVVDDFAQLPAVLDGLLPIGA